MTANRLRVYYGPEDDCRMEQAPPRPVRRKTVTVPLQEILPMIAEAARNDRTWLADFLDDQVTLSADLYEVMLAYQHYRRPSA